MTEKNNRFFALDENFRSIPPNSLAVLGTTNFDLARAYTSGRVDLLATEIQITKMFDIKETKGKLHSVSTKSINGLYEAFYKGYDDAFEATEYRLSYVSPLLALIATPPFTSAPDTSVIDVGSVIFALNLEDKDSSVLCSEFVGLFEDKLGDVQRKIRQFEAQQLRREEDEWEYQL